jgi:SAM-dependent methyltransferase
MDNSLPDGIPLEHEYRTLIESDSFKKLEQFSGMFLATNKTSLREYMNKWVEDPLHQWSRQWEYPFVFSRVENVIRQEPRARILDAGSGVTFFSYYIKAQFAAASVCCCDYDEALAEIYGQINSGRGDGVEFSVADLRALPYDNESFDMIYSVSVLEHTDDYGKIIEEFYRILRPDGELVVTFDVSLDGMRDISVEKGTELLTALAKRFDKDKGFSLDLKSHVSKPGVFTTITAKGINAGLLPWKYPAFVYQIKSFIKTGRFCSWPPPLTVFCLHLTKNSA